LVYPAEDSQWELVGWLAEDNQWGLACWLASVLLLLYNHIFIIKDLLSFLLVFQP
jgi:hypothetical protein